MTAGIPPEPLPAVSILDRWVERTGVRAGFIALDRANRIAPHPDWFVDELRSRITATIGIGYPDPAPLHDDLCAMLEIPRDALLVTPGIDAALRAVHLAFVRPGDAVVRLDPTYAMIPVYGEMFSARDVPIGYDERLELDSAALMAAIDPSVRLVIVANPNQPTGTMLDADVLAAVVARCAATGALLVIDEAYQDFSGETSVGLAARDENVLVLRTFSKGAGLAGLRVGFAVGSPRVVQALANVRSAGEVNSVGLEAARLAVARPEVVDDYVKLVENGRRAFAERVDCMGLEALPTRANFVNLRLNQSHDPEAVVAALRARGYLVRGPFPEACLARCIRVTIGPDEVMEAFLDVLADVLNSDGG